MYEYHSEDFTEEFDPNEITNGGAKLLTYYKALIRRNQSGFIIDDDGMLEFELPVSGS